MHIHLKPRLLRWSSISLAAAVAVATSFTLNPGSALAAVTTWNNTGTDFNAAGSWSGGAPTLLDTGAFVGVPGVNLPVVTANIAVGNITLDTGGYTLSSTGGAVLSFQTISGNAINASNASGVTTISSDLALARGGTSAVVFNQAGGGELLISGSISQTFGTGVLNLTRSGTGSNTITLSGNNTFASGVSIGSASVRLNMNSSTALGSGALTATGNGATLGNTSGSAITATNAVNVNNAVAGTTTVNNLTYTSSNDLTFSTGVVTLSGNLSRAISVTGSGALSLGGTVNESSAGTSFIKNGVGTLVLGGTVNYTGSTNVAAGTMLINGNASAAVGNVTVANGATLGGDGVLGGATTANSGSNLGPGGNGTAGSLDFNSTLNITGLAGGPSGLEFDLGSVGLGSDLITTGGLTIGSGTLNFDDFTFNILSGFGTGTYTLFDNTSLTGTLGSNLIGTVGLYDATLSLSGNDLVLTVVPEPSAYMLALSGLYAVAWLRRRSAGSGRLV